MIAQNRVLEQDFMDTLNYGFNTTVEQLKIINRGVEFVIEGVGPFNQVVDGKMIYPPDDHSEEEWDYEDDGRQD